MATKKHPHYPNPSIIEAIIEVHLDSSLTNENLDAILKKFEKSFECKKDNIFMYSAAFGEKGLSIVHENTGQVRLQIRKSSQVLAQVFSNRFSVHWIGKYQGWKLFESEFLEIWDRFQKIYPKIQSKKFGLRFINRLDKKTIDQPLKIWFKSSSNYPTNLLNSKSDYFYRGKWTSTDNEIAGHRHVMITIAESELINKDFRPVMYDIDVIHTCEKNVKSNKQMISVISSLHETVWAIFSSSISNYYKSFLKKLSGA